MIFAIACSLQRFLPRYLTLVLFLSPVVIVLFLSSDRRALAEVIDFGGSPDRFKGDGDKEPPRCQIDLPTGSKTPFLIKWSCADNEVSPEDIRTELWIYRKGVGLPELHRTYFGFPAYAYITSEVLGVENFVDGLPVQFRLIATDRAGVSAFSPLLTVTTTANSISRCNLLIVTAGRVSNGEATGVPPETLRIENGAVSAIQLSDTELRITSSRDINPELCEIDSLCDGDPTFSASVTVGEGETTGTLVIASTLVALRGSSSATGDVLTEISLNGTTTIDGTEATVSFSCDSKKRVD